MILNESFVKLKWKLRNGKVSTTIMEEYKADAFIAKLGMDNAWKDASF